jgi:hypothetical protein
MVDGREIMPGSARSRHNRNPPGKAHARERRITADFGSKLIRNQQVAGSSRVAASILSATISTSEQAVIDAMVIDQARTHYEHLDESRRTWRGSM